MSETSSKQLTPISLPILLHSAGVFPEAFAWNTAIVIDDTTHEVNSLIHNETKNWQRLAAAH